MVATEVKQKIQLVKGKFTASEASDIVEALIHEKINFHKIQRLRNWEGNIDCETTYLDGRIGELITEKKIAKDIFAEARKLGYDVQIDGKLEISFIKK